MGKVNHFHQILETIFSVTWQKRGREDCAPKVKHSTFGAQSGKRLSKGDFECAVAGTHHIDAGRNSDAGISGSRCRNAFAIG